MISNQLTLNCTTLYQHSHTTSRDCIPWYLPFLMLPRLLTTPSLPYLRYLLSCTYPRIPYSNLPCPTPSYNALYLPHPILSFAPMAILHLYTILHPTLLKLGRNDTGTKRPRAETTYQIRPNQSAPKIRPNDPDRDDPGSTRPVCILWHGPIFLLNFMRNLWRMKKHNCRPIH